MKIKIIIFSSLIIFAACSSSKFVYNEVETAAVEPAGDAQNSSTFESVSVDKIYCWLDMASGPDQIPVLQLSGSISIPRNDDKYDLDDVSLKLIKINQNSRPYFVFKPAIRKNKREESDYIKEFIFSTFTGKKLVPGFNSEENFDIEFIFDNDGEVFTYKITEQSIEKAN